MAIVIGRQEGQTMRIGRLLIATCIGAVLAVSACSQGGAPVPSPTTVNTAATPTSTAAVVANVPTATDFTVTVQVLSKQCFGSAGCNLTYRIKPSYVGAQPLDQSQKYTVTYQINGTQDGAQINSFTIQGSQAQVPTEEIAQTASSGTQLIAQVTGVIPD